MKAESIVIIIKNFDCVNSYYIMLTLCYVKFCKNLKSYRIKCVI